jgi:hypothetical protein
MTTKGNGKTVLGIKATTSAKHRHLESKGSGTRNSNGNNKG